MRRYVVFGIISLALLLSSISNSSATVAFEQIMTDLNISLVIAGWILTAYQLVQTIVMPLAGKISEVIGRKTSFILYTLLFSVGSVLCALSANVYLLIGARVIQAIGGGGFMPCAAGIVSEEFPESRQRYIGLFSSIFPIGSIIGPNLGGWMVPAFGWRSIFWFNVPLGIIVLVLAWLLLRTEGKTTSGGSIDFTGAGLLFGSMSAFMLGLTEMGNTAGIPWVFVGVFFALGAGLLVPFLLWERRAEEPIIDLKLLRERPFLASNAYNVIYGMCALGLFSLIPLYAVSAYNWTTLQSGVLLTPRSVAMMAASIVTSFSLVKWGYRWPILVGTLIVTANLAVLALQPHGIDVLGFHVSAAVLLFTIVGFCGLGHGTCTPAANNACIELMPDKVATITGLRGMFRSVGSAFGISICTVFLNNIADVHRAFLVVMFAAVVIMLVSLPLIFAMPASPNVRVIKATAVSRP